MIKNKILGFVLALFTLLMFNIQSAYAEQHTATTEFSITVPDYVKITSVTSPVLIANITDRTGNLYSPLVTKFKVVSNRGEKRNLYLKSNVVTDGGYEESMFEQGGQVYIAFANLSKIPTSQALSNCKMGALPKDSPGIVAYPVTSITGVDAKFIRGKNKYEITVNSGTSYVTVNVGQNVLRSSYAANDPRGFYQAVLSLTETDI